MYKTCCVFLSLVCCTWSAVPPAARPLCLAGDFERQAGELLRYIRPPHEQRRMLDIVVTDLERVLQGRWPDCKITLYGSAAIGLALKSSDIDCSLDIPGNGIDEHILLRETEDILKSHPDLFQQIETPVTAVPLLTCVHRPTNIFVDLTFYNFRAIIGSSVVSYYLYLDRRAFDLVTITKYWSSVHDIAHGKQTLPSYASYLLTLFYLQQRDIVPPVAALQKNVTPRELDHWNIAFEPIEYHTDNNETLYELLGGFFKYYSEFDFENTVISPYVGYPITRSQFMHLDSFKEFSLYKRNVANGLVTPFQFGYLNIQDTMIHNENIGRPSSGSWLADRLVDQVRSAAKMYEELSREQFLTALLVPQTRIEAGVLKTFWSGGVGSPEYCNNTYINK